MTCVGIIQPNFVPWRGYFDFMRRCDVFVFLDTVQYTKRDWRNRNRIRRRDGATVWLTAPVVAAPRDTTICDMRLSDDTDWRRKHLDLLKINYGATPFADDVLDVLSEAYGTSGDRLSPFTISLTRTIATYLGVATPTYVSSDLNIGGDREEVLINIVRTVGGTRYLSGPAAKSYITPKRWDAAGIELGWMSYDGYPPYAQIAEPFDPFVSILDLLFMKGPHARDFIVAGKENVVAG